MDPTPEPMHDVVLELNGIQYEGLNQLAASGLHGSTVEEVIMRLIDNRLIMEFESGPWIDHSD